jgi:apolipoprotein N-acyltransferase
VKLHPLLLSILAGLLFAFSWPETGGLTCLIFLAFVPLLMVEDRVAANPEKYRSRQLFFYSYITFFLWNLITTWWVKNASFGGAVMAIVFNALFMSVVFQMYHILRKKTKGQGSVLILASFWMAFEYLHLRWDLTWPWLILGNVFAGSPWMIQWYEYTGVFGGDVWIFAVNFLVFYFLKKDVLSKPVQFRVYWKPVLCVALCLIGPVLISLLIRLPVIEMGTVSKKRNPEIVIVQPNIDPYNEKFNGSYREQLTKMLALAETKIDSNTNCVVFPETALTENLWENDLQKTYSIQALHLFQQNHPKLDIVIGASSAYQYQLGEDRSPTAKKFSDANEYYEDYNTALFLSASGSVEKYHKSKFVPGVEMMPFPALLKPLEKLAINMGGTTGSLCGQKERTVFVSKTNALKIAPAICYESVFGEFVTQYVKKGANVIFIITNDGWWGDTPGYRQHLAYARLRAIETRRSVVRSANTGTSCFIDRWGNVTQATAWWKPAVIKQTVLLGEEQTFYVKQGDYLARIAIGITAFFLLYWLFIRFRRT